MNRDCTANMFSKPPEHQVTLTSWSAMFVLCAGIIKEVINKHGLREKLAMLVTDNPANMVKARRLVIQTDGFKHILEMRWV